MTTRHPLFLACLLVAHLLCGAPPTTAQTPGPPGAGRYDATLRLPPSAPLAPVITEPHVPQQVVNAEDVHMETAPMDDPNLGQAHRCSDWELWTVTPPERVWVASCTSGPEKVHAHLGDGVFVGSHVGRTSLFPSTAYEVRVRHRDATLLWSPWSVRAIETAPATQILPLEEDDAAPIPTPTWRDEFGADVELPFGADQRSLVVEAVGAGPLLAAQGWSLAGNLAVNFDELPDHGFVRVRLSPGASAWSLPPSEVRYTNHEGVDRVLYLPALNLSAGEGATFWIAATGASYVGDPSGTAPDFSTLARSAPVPWSVLAPGFQVDVVATGFRLPVNVAFVPNPGTGPNDPKFYVAELYGSIKVVTNDGSVLDYATDLLNFAPSGAFPGSGELGLSGIVVEPSTGDVFAAHLHSPNGTPSVLHPRVVRLASTDGGLTASSQSVVLDMVGESQGQSHFVSNLSIGPDAKLYVHMGDGFEASTALDLDSFRGKILRVNLDGTAPTDNPFHAPPIGARDYVWASGFRNPFGGAWWEGKHFFVENGPGEFDRLGVVAAGDDFGWNGSSSSMLTGASYTWDVPHAPVNIAFVDDQVFGGSGFPPHLHDRAFVTESGPTWGTGPQLRGKRIVEFELSAGGAVLSGPTPVVEYSGAGKATAVGLAAGPDGLYFTDLYEDLDWSGPTDAGANVLRLRFVGSADFDVSPAAGPPPLVVDFTNTSNFPGATTYHWEFGDGETSPLENPYHVYTQPGLYAVRLEVSGPNGTAVEQKDGAVYVGPLGTGLEAEYFVGTNFQSLAHVRTDLQVDFDWGQGSPAPGVGSDQFSVRWTGEVLPLHSQEYTFLATTDDGVRLWVDGQLLVDRWVDQSSTTHSGTVDLTAGHPVDVVLEMYENQGDAAAHLEWLSRDQPREVVPTAFLFPGP